MVRPRPGVGGAVCADGWFSSIWTSSKLCVACDAGHRQELLTCRVEVVVYPNSEDSASRLRAFSETVRCVDVVEALLVLGSDFEHQLNIGVTEFVADVLDDCV